MKKAIRYRYLLSILKSNALLFVVSKFVKVIRYFFVTFFYNAKIIY